jgi:hypothetical protein
MLADAPLRRQLLLWLLPPIIVLWSASAWLTYTLAYRFATIAYDRALHDSAIALAGQLRIDRSGRVVVDLPQIAQKVLVSDLRDRVYYAVSGPKGEFVMGYSGMPAPPDRGPQVRRAVAPPDPVEDTDAGSGPDIELPPPRFYQAEYRGQPVRIAAMSVPLESLSAGQVDGHALVQVGETLVERREMARDVLIATLLPRRGAAGGTAPRDREPFRPRPHAGQGRPRAARGTPAGTVAERTARAHVHHARGAAAFHRRCRAPVAHADRGTEDAGRTGAARERPGRDPRAAGADPCRGRP